MRIEWALLCRYAETAPDLTVVGGGIDTLVAGSWPVNVDANLVVALAVRYDELERGASGLLALRVLDPELEPCADVPAERFNAAPPQPGHHPGFEGHVYIVRRILFTAGTPGAYSIEARLKPEAPVAVPVTVPLYLVHGPDPA